MLDLSARILGCALGLCVLLLGGCETADGGNGARAASAGPSKETLGGVTPASMGGGGLYGESSNRDDDRMAFLSVRYDPDDFIGAGPAKLLPMLGAPDFVRREGPAQVWQYRAKHCVLDLFLYESGEKSRVQHVELRPRGQSKEPIDRCFSRMRLNRRTKPAG